MSTDISIRVPKEMLRLQSSRNGKVSPAAPCIKKFTMVSLLNTWSRKKKTKAA